MADSFAPFSLDLLMVALCLPGLIALVRISGTPARRQAWLQADAAPVWPYTSREFLIGAFFVLVASTVAQLIAGYFLQGREAADLFALTLAGMSFHGGALLGLLLTREYLKRLPTPLTLPSDLPPASPAATDAALVPRPELWKGGALSLGLKVFLLLLPVVAIASLLWRPLLERGGLPTEEQDLIQALSRLRLDAVGVGFVLLATVIAPISEELIFRQGFYRLARAKIGKGAAALLTSFLFALLHRHWASAFPLMLFGVVQCLAYDRTGRIVPCIVAHGLFNATTLSFALAEQQLGSGE